MQTSLADPVENILRVAQKLDTLERISVANGLMKDVPLNFM